MPDRIRTDTLIVAVSHTNAIRALMQMEQHRGPEFLRLIRVLSPQKLHGYWRRVRLMIAMLPALPRKEV